MLMQLASAFLQLSTKSQSLELAVSSSAGWALAVLGVDTIGTSDTGLANIAVHAGESFLAVGSWWSLSSGRTIFSGISVLSWQTTRSEHSWSSGHSRGATSGNAVHSLVSWSSILSRQAWLALLSGFADVAWGSIESWSSWFSFRAWLAGVSWESLVSWHTWWPWWTLDASLREVEVDWEWEAGRSWWSSLSICAWWSCLSWWSGWSRCAFGAVVGWQTAAALSGRSLVSAEDSSDVFVSGLGSSAHDHHILPRIVGNITKIPELGHDVIVHLVDVAGDDDSSPEASQDGCDATHGAEADRQLQHLKLG